MTAEPLSYAVSFLTLRAYLEEAHGAGAFQRLRDELVRRGYQLAPVIVPHHSYPTPTLCAALDLGRELYGPEDFCERYGRAAADHQIWMVFRFLLRFTSPAWLWQRGADMWRRAHTTGAWHIESRGRWARGTLSDFGVVHAGYCQALVGWVTRMCQLTGARDVTVAHPECRARGARVCVFEARW